MTPERSRCLESLARQILRIERPHPIRVAIDGPDAAGKTTLADELAPMIERIEIEVPGIRDDQAVVDPPMLQSRSMAARIGRYIKF